MHPFAHDHAHRDVGASRTTTMGAPTPPFLRTPVGAGTACAAFVTIDTASSGLRSRSRRPHQHNPSMLLKDIQGSCADSALPRARNTGGFAHETSSHPSGGVIGRRRRRIGATDRVVLGMSQAQAELECGNLVAAVARGTDVDESREQRQKSAIKRIRTFGAQGRWKSALGVLDEARQAGTSPKHAAYDAVLHILMDAREYGRAADVWERAVQEDRNATLPSGLSLYVMKALLGAKEHARVIRMFRIMRIRQYIGRGGPSEANKTTMASFYAARAAEGSQACDDVVEIYKLYLKDKGVAGGPGWDGVGSSLPCMVFRTLYKAKRYEEAVAYLEDALSAKKFCNTILCNMAINCLGKTKQWSEALSVYGRMTTELGVKPDGMTHSIIINTLAMSGKWEEAVSTLDEMLKSDDEFLKGNSASVTSALNSAIHACDKAGKCEEALALLRRADEEGIAVDAISFGTAMNALARLGQSEAAVALFRDMISRKLEPGLVACNYVLTHFSKHRKGDDAVAFLKIMKKAKLKITAVTYSAVITALHRQQQHRQVLETFREMQLYRLYPDPCAIQQVLMACDLLDLHAYPAQVLRDLWKMGGVIDESAIVKAFSILARGTHTDLIREILREMETKSMPPAEGCYTSLISSLCREEKLEEAQELLFSLRDAGRPIRTAAFTSVISSCKQGREWQRALMLFDEMMAAPPEDMLAPNQYTYNALISVLTYAGRLDLAALKFRQMFEAGFEYDQITFANMILGFARLGRHEDVLVMFRGLETLTAAKTVDGVWLKRQKCYWASYNEAMKSCEAVGDYLMARRILKAMRQQALSVDVVVCGAAIGACARAGRWKEALDILREMESVEKVQPNVVCYSSAITACEKGGEWRKALHLLLKMINSGVTPDTIAYNASIRASAKCGEWQMALKLFDSLFRAGLRPDVRTYSAAILACFKGKQWQKAMELFGRMIQDDNMPEKHTINLLIELLDEEGQYEKAVYVFEMVFKAKAEPQNWDPTRGDVVDLHGYSAAVAKAAIRSGLSRLLRRFLTAEGTLDVVQDFTFITGVGKHSKRPFEPVLRPAAQNMLLEEFDPPLETHFADGNTGCLQVRKRDLEAWCIRQSEAGKNRIPAPADALGSLKLRGVEELQREYAKVAAAGGLYQEGSGVGWTRNAEDTTGKGESRLLALEDQE